MKSQTLSAPHRERRGRRHERGFTLVETMIVVAIAGVLSSVVYPSLENSLLRARRSDALVALMDAQLGQERFRANNVRYGSGAEIGLHGTSMSGHYAVAVQANDAERYDLLASAAGLQRRDVTCRYLRVRMDGDAVVYASGADSATTNADAANRGCWNR